VGDNKCASTSTQLIITATIHQPRSDIWQLADNVTLLARGGLVAFSGKRQEAVPYFTHIGYPMPSEYFNPADHLLDLVSVDPRRTWHDASKARVDRILSAWQSAVAEVEIEEESNAVPPIALKKGEGTTSMFVALPVVLGRHWTNLWRRKDVSGSNPAWRHLAH
jgi:hypothetical protein